MKRRQVFAIGLVVAIGVGAHAAGTPKPGVDWPQFRGIRAGGVAEGFPLAEAWDIPSGRGVRWKTAIPGLGLASPIVWGDLDLSEHVDQRSERRRAQGWPVRRRQAGD